MLTKYHKERGHSRSQSSGGINPITTYNNHTDANLKTTCTVVVEGTMHAQGHWTLTENNYPKLATNHQGPSLQTQLCVLTNDRQTDYRLTDLYI